MAIKTMGPPLSPPENSAAAVEVRQRDLSEIQIAGPSRPPIFAPSSAAPAMPSSIISDASEKPTTEISTSTGTTLLDTPEGVKDRLHDLSRTLSGTAAPPLGIRKRDFGFLPIPKSRRYDPSMKPEECFPWTWRLNALFATCATVAVMNLYYVQPMLVNIAENLGNTNQEAARISVLVQAGYGVGIAFVSPLGDLVRRRQLILFCMVCTTALSVGLALARNIEMLMGVSFLVGLLSIPPQICIPWTADLAPSNIRARSMSITLAGLIFGLCLGRLFGGILSNFASWRDTYWFAIALQGAMIVVLWYGLPDTPPRNADLSYLRSLWSMLVFLTKYPTLVQTCLIACLTSVVFAGFWTTLTFLLSNSPYHYSSFSIGLFGLLGIIGALLAPQWGRLVDRVVPWLGQCIGISISLTAMIIALAGAERSIGAVAVSLILYDMGQQCAQISGNYRVSGIEPLARARMNALVLIAIFIGQCSGTAILTTIYNYHGWTMAGATAVTFVGTALLILMVRGPHEVGWAGWRGGREVLKREKLTDLSPEAITEGRIQKIKEKVKDKVLAAEEGAGLQPMDAGDKGKEDDIKHTAV